MKLRGTKWILMTVALTTLAGGRPLAQDHEHEAHSVEDVHERMFELMGKVEKRLKAIDELLNEAAARGKPASAGATAVEQVLSKSRDSAHQNIEDIDELLRISQHEHPAGPPGAPSGGT